MNRDEIRLADLRLNYEHGALDEANLADDGLAQFEAWLKGAVEAEVWEVNAMTLATCGVDGQPSARTVLLKALDARGLQFFTNFNSRKSRALGGNARAAAVFFWRELERQVCLRGTVSRVPRQEVEVYFKSRPYESQIGAWVSTQSEVIPDRDWLEKRDREFRARFPEGEVPLPDFWGGFILNPVEIEFWQGRPGRLHDRFLYTRVTDGWRRERLSP